MDPKELPTQDLSSFESMIKSYQNQMFKYCYLILGNEQEAEDAVQEIFIKAFVYQASYRYEESYTAWLYTIASNHCRSLGRRKQKWHQIARKLALWPAEPQHSAETIYWLDGRRLTEDFTMLSGLEKSILILHSVEKYTFSEISNILNIRTDAVRKKYERLKKKIISSEDQMRGKNNERGIQL